MPNARSVSKRQKVTQIKTATPEKPEPSTARKGIRLAGIQERIADAVADMIISGSTRQNLTRLIHATISHDYRTQFSIFDEDRLNRSIGELQNDRTEGLLDELAHERTVRLNLSEKERPEPSDIREKIRWAARNRCATLLNEFIQDGGPEDIRLMHDIMVDYTCAHNAWISDASYGDAGLASAFMDQMENRDDYIRVPHSMVDDVTKYIDALWKLEPNEKKTAEVGKAAR